MRSSYYEAGRLGGRGGGLGGYRVMNSQGNNDVFSVPG